MFHRCPKCGHRPLPVDQSLPAACPACGVILAKVARRLAEDAGGERPGTPPARAQAVAAPTDDATDWGDLLLHVPDRVDPLRWAARVVLLVVFTVWGLWLMTRSVADGELMASFIHLPLLVFHEAGHVLFMPFGEWMTVAGGTLMQWLMPAVLTGALLLRNRDPFGAAIGLWLLGVSLMDTAPYVYDALHPKLMLLGGRTGEEGGHDFIYLLDSLGLRHRAHGLGRLVHAVGAAVMLAALAWAAALLAIQRGRRDSTALEG